MKSDPLDKAIETIPPKCRVVNQSHASSPGYLALHVFDAGRPGSSPVLAVSGHPSNTGSTFVLQAVGWTCLRKWDEVKVAAMIVSGFYLAHVPFPKKSWPSAIHRILRAGPWPRTDLPSVVTEITQLVHAHYLNFQGEDVRMAIERLKGDLARVKDHVTEEDMVRWYREAVVQEVLTS